MLAALGSHRTAVALIVIEIALAFAVISNAIVLISQRVRWMQMRSGVDLNQLVFVSTSGAGRDPGPIDATVLGKLRLIPGVRAAAIVNTVPFAARTGTSGFFLDPGQRHFGRVADFYFGTPGYLRVLGVRLLAGRGFAKSAYRPFALFPQSGGALIDQSLANLLWPGQDPLGRMIWIGKQAHYTIIGITGAVIRPDPQYASPADAYDSVFLPAGPSAGLGGGFVMRTAPAERDRILRAAYEVIHGVDRRLIIDRGNSGALTDLRAAYFRRERIMIGLLAGIIGALMLVTGVGILGLSAFWVQQRSRHIGIRRAVGARSVDVLRYFQTENFLIVTAGILVGCGAAVAANLWLMAHYAVPRLPVLYLPIGAVMLWLLGQVAVLWPALRAAALPPTAAIGQG